MNFTLRFGNICRLVNAFHKVGTNRQGINFLHLYSSLDLMDNKGRHINSFTL